MLRAAASLSSLVGMTTAQDVSEITSAERAARLTAAGAAWGERIDADRTSSHLTFRASGVGTGSVATRVRAGRHEFVIDEPAPLAGDDLGATPVEYALGALIGCQTVVYRLYAQVLGIPFDEIRITAEGDLDAARLFGKDPSVRAGFSEVRLAVELDGPATAADYDRLREVVDANCPVHDLFSNPTPIRSEVRVTQPA